MSGIPLKSRVSIPEWVHLIQLAECVTLRGEPEWTRMQNMEYLHAHDCHQNVTHNLMNLKKSMCIGCLWHACQETTRCLQRCLFTVRLMNIQADIQTVTTHVCIVTERIQFASAQQSTYEPYLFNQFSVWHTAWQQRRQVGFHLLISSISTLAWPVCSINIVHVLLGWLLQSHMHVLVVMMFLWPEVLLFLFHSDDSHA